MGTGIQTSSNNGITNDIHSQRRKRKPAMVVAGDVGEDDDLQGWARTNDLLGHRSQSPDASASIATCNTAYGYRSRLWCEKPVASPEAERCVLPSPELESNLRHPAYKTGALPTELSGQTRSHVSESNRPLSSTKGVPCHRAYVANVSYAS